MTKGVLKPMAQCKSRVDANSIAMLVILMVLVAVMGLQAWWISCLGEQLRTSRAQVRAVEAARDDALKIVQHYRRLDEAAGIRYLGDLTE